MRTPKKFRCWDKLLKKYIPFNAMYFDNDKDYIIEQFTGIKDVNGKEIFEGDFVKTLNLDIHLRTPDEEWTEYSKGEINFYRCAFKICQGNIGAVDLEKYLICSCCNCEFLEVIGNVNEV